MQEHEKHSESKVTWTMPPLTDVSDEQQYTGKGWVPVDAEAARERLREIQQRLAVRQAEIEAGDGE